MSTLPCDLVLLPESSLAEKAVAASQALARLDSKFTLDNKNFYAHMSLYMCQLDEADIPKVEELLQAIAAKTPPYTAPATRYDLGTGYSEGYIDAEYEATEQMHAIQMSVIEAINPVRAGMRDKDIAKMEDATGVKLENLKTYGFPSIGELFRPHMTLSRLQEYKPDAVDSLPELAEFDGTFDRLGLFEMGDNGTCVRKLAEIPLVV